MQTTLSIASALLLAAAPVFAIPPEDFGFPSAPNHTVLSMSYTNNGDQTNVLEASLYGYGIPQNQPLVGVNTSMYSSLADYDGAYILIMADPDARTPQDPSARWYWHWAQSNLRKSTEIPPRLLSADTEPIIPYARPMPPTTSDAHRYIFYLFEQPNDFAVPDSFSSFNASNRASFNLTQFVSDANLGEPAAAQYFFVSHKTSVPDDFVGAPGSEYPGGNGGAILAGPGPSITPSMSVSGSMSGSMTDSMSASMTDSSMTGSMSGSMTDSSMTGSMSGSMTDSMSASMTGSMTASMTGSATMGSGDASSTAEDGSMSSQTAAAGGNAAPKMGAGAGAAGLAAAAGAALLVAV